MSDGQLLEQFQAQPGVASEAAFEVLVRRHGPIVRAHCRGILRNDHDADDAFQATFLVLARRASNIHDPDRLANWLVRVARRIALRSRGETAHRVAFERQVAVDHLKAAPAAVDLAGAETVSLVRKAVDRLPEADLRLLRLTYWQGKTYQEVAEMLSLPVGTVRSRLSRLRERLRGSLIRLGLAPALAVTGSASLVEEASAAQLSEALVLQTVRAAIRSTAGLTTAVEAGTVSATVAALVNGELSMMLPISWKTVAICLLFGGTVTLGGVSVALRNSDAGTDEPARVGVASQPVNQTPQKKAESKSLLKNRGVEEGEGDLPKAWTVGARISGVEYLWSRDIGHMSKASLCLKKTAQRYFPIAEWSQTLEHTGNSPRLKVSAWVKADKATKAILDAQFLDGSGESSHAWVAYIGPKEAGKPPVTHDWKRYEGVVTIPPGTKQIAIAPQIYGPGRVWFDDLDAEYTNDPTTDPTGS